MVLCHDEDVVVQVTAVEVDKLVAATLNPVAFFFFLLPETTVTTVTVCVFSEEGAGVECVPDDVVCCSRTDDDDGGVDAACCVLRLRQAFPFLGRKVSPLGGSLGRQLGGVGSDASLCLGFLFEPLVRGQCPSVQVETAAVGLSVTLDVLKLEGLCKTAYGASVETLHL